VQSSARTVDEYIAEAPRERQAALELLRSSCREGLPGFAESMSYGMPSYARNDVVEVGFASQKRYISLYVLRPAALQASSARLAGLSVGKGCIRFRRPEQIDPELVRDLLAATLVDGGSIC
jgi:uncharacterized protein YdhG (YjbR/CyaY superfamily)